MYPDEQHIHEQILDPEHMISKLLKTQMENYKNSWRQSLDDIHMEDNNVVMKKKYADKLVFEFIDMGYTQDIYDNLKESIQIEVHSK